MASAHIHRQKPLQSCTARSICCLPARIKCLIGFKFSRGWCSHSPNYPKPNKYKQLKTAKSEKQNNDIEVDAFKLPHTETWFCKQSPLWIVVVWSLHCSLTLLQIWARIQKGCFEFSQSLIGKWNRNSRVWNRTGSTRRLLPQQSPAAQRPSISSHRGAIPLPSSQRSKESFAFHCKHTMCLKLNGLQHIRCSVKPCTQIQRNCPQMVRNLLIYNYISCMCICHHPPMIRQLINFPIRKTTKSDLQLSICRRAPSWRSESSVTRSNFKQPAMLWTFNEAINKQINQHSLFIALTRNQQTAMNNQQWKINNNESTSNK